MIVLDTNVISEMMRPEPVPSVVSWMHQIPTRNLYTTAICEAEIFYGLRIVPGERRRDDLITRISSFMATHFASRVLPFDSRTAQIYGVLAAHLRALGKGADTADIQIAAITRQNGFALATRNTRHFEHCGIELIDPFSPAA